MTLTQGNKWLALLKARAFWIGVAMALVPFMKEFFGVDLSAEQITGVLMGLGTMVAYLIGKDFQESGERKKVLEVVSNSNMTEEDLKNLLLSLGKKPSA